MIDLLGLLLALSLLIFWAYRGVSILILSPLMALLALIFAGNLPILATYTQIFMPAAGRFIVLYFPLFLLGALFGKLMQSSGAAQTISASIVETLGPQKAMLSVVLVCAVLTYGGVSLFVVAFATYPIAAALFKQAEIPKRLIPATIALGAFTFTMTALPGTPAIQNAIPMPYFQTTPFAAPMLGTFAAIIMFGLGLWWLNAQAGRAKTLGERYGNHRGDSAETTALIAPALPVLLAWLPILLVIVLNYVFGDLLFPALNTAYLQEMRYGSTNINSVKGIWAIVASLALCSLLLLLIMWRQRKQWPAILESGANSSILPIFNTASLVGFGAVVATLPAFEMVKSGLDMIDGNNPLLSIALSVNVLAGITGSASGGMSIALDTLGTEYIAMAQSNNISMDLLHRITAVATGGLDSLPHNGAVVTLLGICGLSHKESYKDIFVVAVLIPLIALAVLVVLGTSISD